MFTTSFQGTVADFFSFVDERITQYAKTIQSVAFRCSTTVRANVHLTYLDAQVSTAFRISLSQPCDILSRAFGPHFLALRTTFLSH